MKLISTVSRVAVAASALAVGVAAKADPATGVDVTGVVATIGAQAAPIALVGGAVLAIVVAVKAFHWVRRAIS